MRRVERRLLAQLAAANKRRLLNFARRLQARAAALPAQPVLADASPMGNARMPGCLGVHRACGCLGSLLWVHQADWHGAGWTDLTSEGKPDTCSS